MDSIVGGGYLDSEEYYKQLALVDREIPRGRFRITARARALERR